MFGVGVCVRGRVVEVPTVSDPTHSSVNGGRYVYPNEMIFQWYNFQKIALHVAWESRLMGFGDSVVS